MRGIWSNNFWHYCFIYSLSESDYDEIQHEATTRAKESLSIGVGISGWRSGHKSGTVLMLRRRFKSSALTRFSCVGEIFDNDDWKKKYRLTFFSFLLNGNDEFFFRLVEYFFSHSKGSRFLNRVLMILWCRIDHQYFCCRWQSAQWSSSVFSSKNENSRAEGERVQREIFGDINYNKMTSINLTQL